MFTDGKYYQQGDVLIKRCSRVIKFPVTKFVEKVAIDSENRIIIKMGSATGNFHYFDNSENIEVVKFDNVIYIKVKSEKGIQIKHQTHKPITIAKGNWFIDYVKEIDPVREAARYVMD